MLADGTQWHEAGYTPITARLSWDAEGSKKVFRPCLSWKTATHDNCMEKHVVAEHGVNSIAIVTGVQSNVIVVDLDVAKEGKQDGVAAYRQQEPVWDAPTVLTPSGGMHVYYSLSKSKRAGLSEAGSRSRTDVALDDTEPALPTAIDIRGEGGLIIAPPTSYERGVYKWRQGSGLTATADLPALPAWLIAVLNRAVSQPMPMPCILRMQQADLEGLVGATKACIEREFNMRLTRVYNRKDGFDFDVADRSVPCYCGRVHDNNMWCVRMVLPGCFIMRNYSKSCTWTIVGWKRWKKHRMLQKLWAFPDTDKVFAELLLSNFVEAGMELKWDTTADKFMMFNRHLWQPIHPNTVAKQASDCGLWVLGQAELGLKGLQEMTDDEDLAEELSEVLAKLRVGQKHLSRARTIRGVVDQLKIDADDPKLHEKMDADPNLLGTPSGVLDLRTGDLVPGRPYVSLSVGVQWKGLETDTSKVERFFHDVLGSDQEAVAYMQRVLGYGTTGRVEHDLLLVFWGSGSNGKSSTVQLLAETLGDYYGTMHRHCVAKPERAAAAGSATPHLAALHKLRMAVCEELQEDDRLHDATIKQMTGGSRMQARALYGDPIEFVPTHLPIIVTNLLPAWSSDDLAMVRRLRLVPFHTRFVEPEVLDASNPHHRPRDNSVRVWMSSQEAKEQMLVWLVKGAMASYKGLGSPPALFAEATNQYKMENDPLGSFLTDCCIRGKQHKVESMQLLHAYNDVNPDRQLTNPSLKRKLQEAGFEYKRETTAGSKRTYVKGLSLAA